jgi:hypothetical protein
LIIFYVDSSRKNAIPIGSTDQKLSDFVKKIFVFKNPKRTTESNCRGKESKAIGNNTGCWQSSAMRAMSFHPVVRPKIDLKPFWK